MKTVERRALAAATKLLIVTKNGINLCADQTARLYSSVCVIVLNNNNRAFQAVQCISMLVHADDS